MDCHSHHFDDQCLRSMANTPPWSVRLSVLSMNLFCCLNFWLPRIVPRFHFENYWHQTNFIHYDGLWEDLFHPSSPYIEIAHAETASGSNNHIPPPYITLVKSSEELSSHCGENAAKFLAILGANVDSQELFDSPCAKSVLQWYATDVEQSLSRSSRTTKSASANRKKIPTPASIQSRIEVLHLGVRKSFALSLPSILQHTEQEYNFTEIRTDINQRINPVLCYYDDQASFTDGNHVRNQCRVVYSDVAELCDVCTLMEKSSGDAYATHLLRSQFALFIPGPESFPSRTSASTEVASSSRICSQLISFWMEAALLGSIPVIPYSASASDSLAHRCVNLGHPFFSMYSKARHGIAGNFTDQALHHIPHVSAADLMGYLKHFSTTGNTSLRLSAIAARFYSSKSDGSTFLPSQRWDISHLFVTPHLAHVVPWAAIQAHLPRQPDKIQAFHALLDVLRPYLQSHIPSKTHQVQAICQLQDSHEIMATNTAVQQLHDKLVYRGRYSPRARTKATPKAAAPNGGSTPPSQTSTTATTTTTTTSTTGSHSTARTRSIATVALQRPLRPHRSLLKTAEHTTTYTNHTSPIASSLPSGSSLEIVLPRCCETFEGDLMWLDKVMSAVLASSPTKASPSTEGHLPTIHVSLYYKCPQCLPRRYARTWQETIVGPTIERLRCPANPSPPTACLNQTTTNSYTQDDAYQQILRHRGILFIDDGVLRLQSHVAKDPKATPLVTANIGDGHYVTTVGRLRLHEIPAFDWQSNGKEATAYLQHLRDRHATLATYTFFLHTQPAHHLQFGRFLRLLLYLHTCAIPPSSATARPAASWPVPAIDFIPLNYRWFAGVWAHLPERCALAVLHYLFRSSTASQYYIAGDEIRALPGINDIRTFLQQVPMASGVAAQFVVSRTTLQQRPASFYGRLYDLLTHEVTTVANASIAATAADQHREREVFRHCRKRSYAVGTEVASAYERLWPHFFRAVVVAPRGDSNNNSSSSSGSTDSSTHFDPLNHKFKAGSAEERAFSSPLALPDFPHCCRAQLPKFVWYDPTEGVA